MQRFFQSMDSSKKLYLYSPDLSGGVCIIDLSVKRSDETFTSIILWCERFLGTANKVELWKKTSSFVKTKSSVIAFT